MSVYDLEENVIPPSQFAYVLLVVVIDLDQSALQWTCLERCMILKHWAFNSLVNTTPRLLFLFMDVNGLYCEFVSLEVVSKLGHAPYDIETLICDGIVVSTDCG